MTRSGRSGQTPRTPQFPTYQAPPTTKSPAIPSFDSYEAEKKKTFASAPKGKGMQLGKKSKTTDMFEKVRNELGAPEESAPLISSSSAPSASTSSRQTPAPAASDSLYPINVTINETISAEVSREGAIRSFEVKGDLQLRITDPSLNKIRLSVTADDANNTVQYKIHPNVDKALFNSSKAIQAKDENRPFPANGQSLGVLRWRLASKPGVESDSSALPITFVVWVNPGASPNSYAITVEYELTDTDEKLEDVVISIPYQHSEPVIASQDEVYEVTGDSLDWNIKHVDASNSSGSFEFEAGAEDEGEFFPMEVRFSKATPFVNVDVSYPPIHLGSYFLSPFLLIFNSN